MEAIRERVAGLDVHRDVVVACALSLAGRKRRTDKASFATTTAGLGELASWLADHDVEAVAMEATGVYWKCVYYALEGLFDDVMLCNAQHVKNVPGRKTDLSDAEWLADVVAHGMVRASFVPPPPVRELRELTRYRKTQISIRGQEVQRLDKVLQDAGIKLSSVTSKVLGRSTRDMVEALIAGERDPERLAQFARTRMRTKIPALEQALVGHFGAHHAVVARRALAHIDFLDATIEELTGEVLARLGPFQTAVELACTMPGIEQLTAQVFVAETGGDMSQFPTPKQLAAWVGFAPANHQSAGKRRAAGTRKGGQWLRRAMIEAAWAATRSRGTYYAAQFRRLSARIGPNKAIIAVAHSMTVALWHMLSTGTPHNDLGADWFRRQDPDAQTRRLVNQLQALGHRVTLTPAA
ncbi:MAG TPA: IS110 family transposase [Acidimicrobiales bacterium]|nr:IS110 family transposase [Acidimicrobiales bacterium]